jgi:hypothetical protein
MMTEVEMTRMEARLRTAAATFPYPPTPDIAAGVRRRLQRAPSRRPDLRRRWATAVLLAALAAAALLSVPQVRAGLLEVIQIGVIRILLASPTPSATPTGAVTRTPPATAPVLTSVLDLAGETTLAEARELANFTILLPSYPADLGQPDRVFVQDMGGPVVVLVWVDPAQPGTARLSLHQFGPDSFAAEKVQPQLVATTTVNGNPAVWTEGPYLFILRNGKLDQRRLVDGHVLVWEDSGMTYRVETSLTLEEAVKIAESMR